MSLRPLPLLASLALLAVPVTLGAALAPKAPETVAVDGDDALHEAMEGLQSGMRDLRKLISPEGQAEAIATVVAMQGHVLEAFTHVPALADGADEATWGTDYKRRMLKLGLELVNLEEKLIAGDMEGAKASYGALREHKDGGHDKYYPE